VIAELRAMAGRIAIFSHGQFLRALAVRWIGLPIEQGCHFGLDTGSLGVLGFERNNVDTAAILLWNAVSNDIFELIPRPIAAADVIDAGSAAAPIEKLLSR
jgi:broad specificity phosphatase PhoE